jgi:G3E family GTPase
MSDIYPVPVYLLTGFLGSGKTTLLNSLLPTYPMSALVINELGDIGIDDQLLKHHGMPLQLMAGGCICCTVQGELLHTLRNLLVARKAGDLPAFERLIIETTGAADPGNIVEMLTKDRFLAKETVLAGVITTVDVEAGEQQFSDCPEVIDQVLAADLLLLTKSDRVSDIQRETFAAHLRELNGEAEQQAIFHGQAPADVLAQVKRHEHCRITGFKMLSSAPVVPLSHARVLQPATLKSLSRLENGIQAASLRLNERVTETQALDALSEMFRECGDVLLRFKGLFALREADFPFLIQACRQKLEFPELLPAWPSDDHGTRMVLIVRHAESGYAQKHLEKFGQRLLETSRTAKAVST